MEKVVIGLTSIQSRQDKLHLTLASLLAQDYPNFEVRLFTSREPFLLDTGCPDLSPDSRALLREDRRLKWLQVSNFGPYRKLLPILADTLDSNSLIVTADDDTLYPAHWLSTLVHYYRRHKCVIGSRGHQMARGENGFLPYRRWMNQKVTTNPSVFLLPTGKDGVLYHPSFFHPGVLDIRNALKHALTADDLWFKWHTAVNRVPVYLINTDFRSASLPDTNDGPSLYKDFNVGGANDVTIAALEKYSAAQFGTTVVDLAA